MAEYIDIDTPLELKVVWGQTYKPYTSTLRELLDVNSIPYTAADVTERKKGKWIRHLSDRFGAELNDCIECNCCGVWFSSDEMLRRSFCPNCGADMRGENDV